uniref:UBX domain-containing protein n=1 Tax=Rhizophora mucronata TaxID=61149 RepID=A0A2P2J833_RHIMU
MDNSTQESSIPDLNAASAANAALVESFCEITSSSKEEALFFLESHQWDLDAAVSTFLDSNAATTTVSASTAATSAHRPIPASADSPPESQSPSESHSLNYSPSQSSSLSRSRSRSPSSPTPRASYQLRSREIKSSQNAAAAAGGSRTRGGIRTLNDLNRAPSSSDEDEEPQQYYTGGEKSGMLVQDPTKNYGANAIFDQARHSGAAEIPADYLQPSSSSRSFTGTGRLLSGETVSAAPQPPEAVNHTVTLWRNGFTVDDGPLRRFDDPANTAFLESIMKSECPKELEPADRRTKVHLDLMRQEDNYSEHEQRQIPFQGVGRTLCSRTDATASETVPAASLKTAPLPATGLVVDSSSPTTSIQLRLADGTRMISRFNLNHTVRDLRAFIEASRPGGARNYLLLTMGFPPKQLTDLDLTIEEAGIANSVVIQKF